MGRASSEEKSASPGWLRRLFRLCARAAWTLLAWISAPLLLAGLAVRLTVRDDVDGLAILFYATPWLVLAAFAAVCAIHWRSRPRILWSSLVLLCGILGIWAYKNIALAPPLKGRVAFRMAYWNVARPEWRLDSILGQSSRMAADFYVFGEHRPGTRTPDRWSEHFAGRSVTPLTRELLLVAPGEVKRIDGGSLGGAGGCQLCRTVVDGKEVFLLLVDFTATFHKSRRPAFERLFQIVDAYAAKPLVVVGDFNTPADSAHFDRLRARLSSAFETAGHGYAATWPMPLPVHELDHIWTNKHLRVLRCEHPTSIYSDHRAVVADIAFP